MPSNPTGTTLTEGHPSTSDTYSGEAAIEPKKHARLTDTERAQILRLRFGEGLSIEAIAKGTRRSMSTVSEFLAKFPDRSFEALAMLKSEGPRAVSKWSEALEAAAARGDHRPMRDLLLGVGVIQDKAVAPTVAVVVNMPDGGARMPPELLELDE